MLLLQPLRPVRGEALPAGQGGQLVPIADVLEAAALRGHAGGAVRAHVEKGKLGRLRQMGERRGRFMNENSGHGLTAGLVSRRQGTQPSC
jgi:hypothetical protein